MMEMPLAHDVGVTWYEEDAPYGPFKIRLGGTNEFVTAISIRGVSLVEGWEADVMMFETIEQAVKAAARVWDIEGFHTSVECTNHPKAVCADQS
jgi:hypothetical protein